MIKGHTGIKIRYIIKIYKFSYSTIKKPLVMTP